ncbi:MAG: hypothetical protein U9Q15_02955 [Patescibacteria group bacterium]|nr:hypothetical protein [Patescibacteria group bacterium]
MPHIIFLAAMGVETLTLTYAHFFMKDLCGSPCALQSFINPIGFDFWKPQEVCAMVCTPVEHILFYVSVDLLLLTAIAYWAYTIHEVIHRAGVRAYLPMVVFPLIALILVLINPFASDNFQDIQYATPVTEIEETEEIKKEIKMEEASDEESEDSEPTIEEIIEKYTKEATGSVVTGSTI